MPSDSTARAAVRTSGTVNAPASTPRVITSRTRPSVRAAQVDDHLVVVRRQGVQLVLHDPGDHVAFRVPGDEPLDQRAHGVDRVVVFRRSWSRPSSRVRSWPLRLIANSTADFAGKCTYSAAGDMPAAVAMSRVVVAW